MKRLITGNPRITQDYFEWLCDIAGVWREEPPYYLLAKALHDRAFTGELPHDENRAGDGIALRDEYAFNGSSYPDTIDLTGPCSVLEMLIGVAKRMDFVLSSPDDDREYTGRYFFELIGNLGLEGLTDDDYAILGGEARVDDAVGRLMRRTYDPDGRGGLFPLRRPVEDQRYVEIWYQMNAYLMERYP